MKECFEGFLLLLCIFQSVCGNILAYIFGLDTSLTLKVFAVVSLIISFLYYVKFFTSKAGRNSTQLSLFSLSFFSISLVSVLVINSFHENQMMNTYLLSFFSSGFSGVFFGVCTKNGPIKKKILSGSIIFPYAITLCLLFPIIHNFNINTNNWDFDYQLLSYAAARSALFFLGINLYFKDVFSVENKKTKLLYWTNWSFFLLSVFEAISGGGRGAFIAIILGIILFFVISLSKKQFTIKQLCTAAALVFCFLIVIVPFLNSTSDGLETIKKLFTDGLVDQSSSIRLGLYSKAWSYSIDNYMFGYGLGSTAYEIGFYTHSIFLDFFVDFGLIGLIFLVLGLLFLAVKSYFFAKKDYYGCFLFYVFVCSATMLCFSGCWFETTDFLFVVFAILVCSEENDYSLRKKRI